MFERDEVLQALHRDRLTAAGINPLDPKVQSICRSCEAHFYAEKTREVLQKMQEVLSKIEV